MALADGYNHQYPGNETIRDGYLHSPPANSALRDGYDNVLVTTGPLALRMASVTGSTLTLTFNKALNTGSVPANGDFSVTVAGTANAVTAVAIAGSVVTLTLTTAVTASQTVLLSYTPGTNPIQNAAADEALAAISDFPVTNTEEAETTYRFDSIADFNAVFDQPTTGTQEGAWVFDAGGSSGSGGTGPSANNPDGFCYSEMSGSTTIETKHDNSAITINDTTATVVAWLAGKNRRMELETSVQSGGGSTGSNGFANSATSGFAVEGQRMGSTDWERIAFINGWMYEATTRAGETITTFFSMEDHTVSRDGGWIKWPIMVPEWAESVRCIVETDGTGTGWGNDTALHTMILTHGGV